MRKAKLLIKLGCHGVKHTKMRITAKIAEDTRKAKWAFIFDQGEFGYNYWRR